MTKVHVSFVNAATNELFGEVDLPIERLPETFEHDTTMHLGDADWTVERAEPGTRTEFAETGTLRLTMRKIEHLDPKTILFSLPTIENALPPGHTGSVEGAHRMREDDWRQVELVSAKLEPDIEAELAQVREVHEDSREGSAYKRIHVRQRILAPLDGSHVTVADVARVLGEPERQALAVHQSAGVLVTGGFAFTSGHTIIYGREDSGLVVELGIDGEVPPAIEQLADRHGLFVVYWCRASARAPA
ncbi:MAG: hypothetical protein ABI867_19570 [Kofleriaceae bacterium]